MLRWDFIKIQATAQNLKSLFGAFHYAVTEIQQKGVNGEKDIDNYN